MNFRSYLAWPGAPLAIGSAILFGASTPFAKLLLGGVSPWLLAGLRRPAPVIHQPVLRALGAATGELLSERTPRAGPRDVPRGADPAGLRDLSALHGACHSQPPGQGAGAGLDSADGSAGGGLTGRAATSGGAR